MKLRFLSWLFGGMPAAVETLPGNNGGALLALCPPQRLADTVVSEGNPAHEHGFQMAPWDRDRLGSDFVDPDEDHGGQLEYPMATYKMLYQCSCGREVVQATRALI